MCQFQTEMQTKKRYFLIVITAVLVGNACSDE